MSELNALVIISCARLTVVGIAIYGAWQLMMNGVRGWGWLIFVAIILGAFNARYESTATCPNCGTVFKVMQSDNEKRTIGINQIK